MKTFFGRLKNEMYYGYEKDYSSCEQFSHAIKEYIDYYNNERIQAKTKWMPPNKIQGNIHTFCIGYKKCVHNSGYISILVIYLLKFHLN